MEMESHESKTTGLSWEVTSNSSKWLAENLKDMDQSVKRMVKLIEEDASDTSKLISNVEEFHQLYRSLAERYDGVTRESCKSGTLGSGDPESPLQTPEVKVHEPKSADQSAGTIDTSPSSPDANSVFSSSSSSSDSDSESFVTSYLRTPLSISSQTLHQKMTELEAELSAAKDKLQARESDLEVEIENLKRELLAAKDKLQTREADLEVEIKNLKRELLSAKDKLQTREADLEVEIENLKRELSAANDKLQMREADLEVEIKNLKRELSDQTSEVNRVKDQLELARKEITSFEAQLRSEKEHVVELEEMITRYNSDLSDRDIEVWELKVALRDMEVQFSQDRASLESDILSLSEKLARLDAELTESEAQKSKTLDQLAVMSRDFDQGLMRHDELMGSLSCREDQIHEMESYISELHERCNKLVDESREARELVEELKPKVEELQEEVDRQRVVISDGAEEKREAIRQLCLSIEHYRSWYQELRQAFVGNRRNVVMAA